MLKLCVQMAVCQFNKCLVFVFSYRMQNYLSQMKYSLLWGLWALVCFWSVMLCLSGTSFRFAMIDSCLTPRLLKSRVFSSFLLGRLLSSVVAPFLLLHGFFSYLSLFTKRPSLLHFGVADTVGVFSIFENKWKCTEWTACLNPFLQFLFENMKNISW